MDPVTITITEETELVGVLRARCHAQAGHVHNLADECDLDSIIGDRADDQKAARMQALLSHLETARVALEAVHGQTGGA